MTSEPSPATQLAALAQSLPGDQTHLVRSSDPAGLLADLQSAGNAYPGGLVAYIETARRLLNATDQPSVSGLRPGPLVHAPEAGDEAHSANEAAARAILPKTAFVLVAGGLGERLGFSDIKLRLPVDTASSTTYLAHFAGWLRAVAGPDVAFAIMTSDDTHEATVKYLEREKQFGLANLRLIKQETVPCIADREGRLAIGANGRLLRKPHGHGDVHSLLLRSGVAADWAAAGLEYIVFFQDTNAAVTMTVPQSLAAMKARHSDMVFTCVPRNEGEAVGALVSATNRDGERRVQNVEYNVFGAAYAAAKAVEPEAAADPSAYGGSINTLLLRFPVYYSSIQAVKGVVPEFINPKYADESRTVFKAPTRVESLMQDVALVLPPGAVVEGVLFSKELYCPVKNRLADGIALAARGIAAHCGATGEEAMYQQRRAYLRGANVHVDESPAEFAVDGKLAVRLFPIVSFDAAFAALQTDLAQRFPAPQAVSISPRSALVLEGDVTIESLTLDGALVIKAAPGASIRVRRLAVVNQGWSVAAPADGASEIALVRGFVLQRNETRVVEARAGENLVIDEPQSNM